MKSWSLFWFPILARFGFELNVALGDPDRSATRSVPPTLAEREVALREMDSEAEHRLERARRRDSILLRPSRVARYGLVILLGGIATTKVVESLLRASGVEVSDSWSSFTDGVIFLAFLFGLIVLFVSASSLFAERRSTAAAARPRESSERDYRRSGGQTERLRAAVRELARSVTATTDELARRDRAFLDACCLVYPFGFLRVVTAPKIRETARAVSERIQSQLSRLSRRELAEWLDVHWHAPGALICTANGADAALRWSSPLPTLVAWSIVSGRDSPSCYLEIIASSPGAPDRMLTADDARRAELAGWTVSVSGAGAMLRHTAAAKLGADAIVRACAVARELIENADALLTAADS